MLARREPVTLRALVAGRALDHGRVHLLRRHAGAVARGPAGGLHPARAGWPCRRPSDPVRDLAALGAVYVANAAEPELYRAMFDTAAELEDPAAPDPRAARRRLGAGSGRGPVQPGLRPGRQAG